MPAEVRAMLGRTITWDVLFVGVREGLRTLPYQRAKGFKLDEDWGD